MKKLILIILLIAGAIVGSSFQVGRVIEAELPAILARVGDLGQMKISIRSYDRKLFRSLVRSEVSLASIGGNEEKIYLEHSIWHGPFPFGQSSNGQLQLKPMSAIVETVVDRTSPPTGMIGKIFEQCPELYDSFELTRFDFAGNGASTYSIPGFDKSLDDGTDTLTINWQGMNGTATIDKSLKNIKGDVSIPMIVVADEKSGMETRNIRSTYRIYEEYGGLLLGNVTMNIDTINFNSSRGKTSLADFQFRNAAKLNDDTVSYSIAIGIEKLKSGDQSYGPAGFELDFVDLDATTILEVQKRLQTIQSEVDTLSEDELGAHIFAIYAEALPGLMQKTPEIKLNYLNMTGPNGEFWSKGNILFENPEGKTMTDLNSFLGTIKANSDSQISKPLLQTLLITMIKGQLGQAREAGQLGEISDDQFNTMAEGAALEQLTKMVADGAIVDEGKNYRTLFSFENRRATLNGRLLPTTE